MRLLRNAGVSRLAWLAGAPLLVVILGLASYAGSLYAREHAAFDRRRLERLGALSGEQKQLRDGLSAVERRIAGLQADLAGQDERRALAERAAATLRAGDHWWEAAWERLFGSAAAVHTKEDTLARLEQAQAEAAARGAELRATITRATWERDGLEIALGRVERHLAEVERNRPTPAFYLGLAWRKSRWYVIAALAGWMLAAAWWQRRRSGFFR